MRAPALLIAVSTVPILSGLARLAQIAGAPIEMMDTARVLSGPRAVLVAHIVASITFLVLGAMQFSTAYDPRQRRRHRAVGRIAGLAALVAGVSSIWLTLFFPHAPHDGSVLNVVRLLAGGAIVAAILLAYRAIKARRVADHRKWMMRCYALCMATGVQAFVVIGWHLVAGNPAGLTRALIFGGSWCACLIAAELRMKRTTMSKMELPNEHRP